MALWFLAPLIAPAGIIPSQWTDEDIGAVNSAGSWNGTAVTGDGAFGGAADAFFFRHRPAGEGTEIKVNLTGLSSTGAAGAMVRDALTADSAFVFVGRDAAGDIVVLHRRSAGGAVVTENLGSGTGWGWFRLLVGTDTVYVYRSAAEYTVGVGHDVWGGPDNFLRAYKIDLTGEDYGGAAVESGTATIADLIATNPKIWAERTTRATDGSVTFSGDWVTDGAPAEVTESGLMLEHDGTGVDGDVEFPLTIRRTATYEVFVHFVKGSDADYTVEVGHDGGTSAAADPTPAGMGPASESQWVRVGRFVMSAGGSHFVKILSDDTGDTRVRADAVRAVNVPAIGWQYPIWTNHGNKATILGNGTSGTIVKRTNPNNPGWTAAAYTGAALIGDGIFEFVVPVTSKRVRVGLAPSITTQSYTDMSYQIFADDNGKAYPQGGGAGSVYWYNAGVWNTIERVGDTVRFRANGSLVSQATVPSSVPLHLDCSIRDLNGRFQGTRVQGFFASQAVAADLDQDGMPDAAEQPVIDADLEDEIQNVDDVVGSDDYDGDGLSNHDEAAIHQTDLTSPDTDGDGLSDADEVNVHFTDPLVDADLDGDGLSDAVEILSGLGFDHNDSDGDTDNDGLGDLLEWQMITADPNDGFASQADASPASDFDGDGRSSGDEIDEGTDPLDGEDYRAWWSVAWEYKTNTQSSNETGSAGSTLTKVSGSVAWDGGANSQRKLTGDGMFQWRIGPNGGGVIAGLARQSHINNAFYDFDFTIFTWIDGLVYVYEGGYLKAGPLVPYQAGDTFSVRRDGGVITYWKGRQLLYTSAVTTTEPLVADSSIYYVTHGLEGARLSGDDADNDGLKDGEEILSGLGFDPENADSDGDGLGDWVEWVVIKDDPADGFAAQADVLPDGDCDGDGASNAHEEEDGTDPTDPDDYFLPLEFSRFGEVSNAVVTQVGSLGEWTELARDGSAPAGSAAGGISHHEIKDGSRLRFEVIDASVETSVGVVERANALPGGGAFTYRIVVVDGIAELRDDLDVAVHSFPIAVGDLIELRFVIDGVADALIVEKNQVEEVQLGISLGAQPVLVVDLPEAGSAITNGRYRAVLDPDGDEDGLWDWWEQQIVDFDPNDAFDHIDDIDPGDDFDGDGLSNALEWTHGADPTDGDSDGDTLPDGWEVIHGLDPTADDTGGDLDGDGLTNLEEYNLQQIYGTFTRPDEADTDGDGIDDRIEHLAATRDPTSAGEAADLDTDGDQMEDVWEYVHGLNLLDPQDAGGDFDYDRRTNLEEFFDQTTPNTDWSPVEIPGGLPLASIGSFNQRGHLAKIEVELDVNNDPTGYRLWTWNRAAGWVVSHSFGGPGAGDVAAVRQNNFGLVAAAFESEDTGAGRWHGEVRVVTPDGTLHPIGHDQDWGRIDGLEITDTGYVSGRFEDYTGVTPPAAPASKIFRWRADTATLEIVTAPGGGDVHPAGLSERGEIISRDEGIFRRGVWEPLIDEPLAISGGGLLWMAGEDPNGTGTDVWSTASAFAVGYRFNNLAESVAALAPEIEGQFPVHEDLFDVPAGVDPLDPVSFFDRLGTESILSDPEGLPAGSYRRLLIVSGMNQLGDVAGWFLRHQSESPLLDGATAVKEPEGFLWRYGHYGLLGEIDSGSRFWAVTNSGRILVSSIVEDTDNGQPILTEKWMVLFPNNDGDADDLPDDWEAHFGLFDPAGDDDSDLLTNLEEYLLLTDPTLASSDGDSLSDFDEIRDHGSSPLLEDSDGDGWEDDWDSRIVFHGVPGSGITLDGNDLVESWVDASGNGRFLAQADPLARPAGPLGDGLEIDAGQSLAASDPAGGWGFHHLIAAFEAHDLGLTIGTDRQILAGGDDFGLAIRDQRLQIRLGATTFESYYLRQGEAVLLEIEADPVNQETRIRVNDYPEIVLGGDHFLNLENWDGVVMGGDGASAGAHVIWREIILFSEALPAAGGPGGELRSGIITGMIQDHGLPMPAVQPGLGIAGPPDDLDNDGIPNGWELQWGLDPFLALDAISDPDRDMLSNLGEFQAGTDPTDADTDDDGLNDGLEVSIYGSDPLVADTDGDGLDDGVEVNDHHTDPTLTDTDGDAESDDFEIQNGTDPLNPHSRTALLDEDEDGMDDFWELLNRLDPTDPTDAGADPDLDGLTNLQEYQAGSDPFDSDTDDDELTDAEEVNIHGTSPFQADTDGDGLSDFDEVNHYPTDPTLADTDGDYLSDSWEVQYGYDPLTIDDTSLDPDGDLLTDIEEAQYGTDPNNTDTDGDGLDDYEEAIVYGTDPAVAGDLSIDTDGDGLPDFAESYLGYFTDPFNPDTDGDGLSDGWEVDNGFDPVGTLEGLDDWDLDGLTNVQELQHGTDMSDPDTDGDTLVDGDEVSYGTNPHLADTDGDTLPDAEETQSMFYYIEVDVLDPQTGEVIGTTTVPVFPDPLLADTDGDFLRDDWEITNNYDPNDPNDPDFANDDDDGDGLTFGQEMYYGTDAALADTDADGIPDGWEVDHDLDPLDGDDAALNYDGDTLTNLEEYTNGTDLYDSDTDDDEMPDGYETLHAFLDPLDPADGALDEDGDGLDNAGEYEHGTDPEAPHSDTDTMPDGWEVLYDLDPLDGADAGDDPDRDGISNAQEYANSISGDPTLDPTEMNPLVALDTDEDGMTDYWEILRNLDPNDASDALLDSDGDLGINRVEFEYDTDPATADSPNTDSDGIPDFWEIFYGFDPDSGHDGDDDPDNDGLTNAQEYAAATDPLISNDTDGDGMPDPWEDLYPGLDKTVDDALSDPDNDGWTNLEEYRRQTNPIVFDDSDGDTMPDAWEIAHGLDPNDASDKEEDLDGDGVLNYLEYAAGTDPQVAPDTDDDGMPDWWEILHNLDPNDEADANQDPDGDSGSNLVEFEYDTDPHVVEDSDGDGMPDHWERLYSLDPNDSTDAADDPDGDTQSNLAEYQNGTNPRVMEDSDDDGMPDWWENQYGLDPNNAADAWGDLDNDGVINRVEYVRGTDPTLGIDTDTDGMPDGWEERFGLDPRNASDAALDRDRDGLSNLEEFQSGTSPILADSDGDRVPDAFEVALQTDPADAADAPAAALTVDPASGNPAHHTTIQAALDAVTADHAIIEVAAGDYDDSIVMGGTGHTVLLRGVGAGGHRAVRIAGLADAATLSVTGSAPQFVDGVTLTHPDGVAGGGVTVGPGQNLFLSNAAVRGNQLAGLPGAGLHIDGGAVRLENVIVNGNEVTGPAAVDGVAIDVSDGVLDLVHTTVANNTVETAGSALSLSHSAFEAQNSVLWHAEATVAEWAVLDPDPGSTASAITLSGVVVSALSDTGEAETAFENLSHTDPGLTVDGYLTRGSPALDRAEDLGMPIDINLEARPSGPGPDPGGDEFIDTDDDGMPDWFENEYGLDPNDPSDAAGDLNGDGISNLASYRGGFAPDATAPVTGTADGDGDGLSDEMEIRLNRNPQKKDHPDVKLQLTLPK